MTNRTPLSAEEQRAVIDLLLRGASPLIACRTLEIAIERYWLTHRRQQRFRDAVGMAYDSLGRNVVAAVYKAAIEGNVAAQRFWLQQRSAEEWSPTADDLDKPSSGIPSHAEFQNLTRREDAAKAVSRTA